MSDEELIARLREGATWDDDIAAADRIEALTEQLAAARQDAKAAEDELEMQEQEACMMENDYIKLEKERDALDAKLAKAVGALEFLEIAATGSGVPHPKERELLHDCIRKARATLAEIKST